ncbi:MAG: ATP-grasp domain-containing protein [Anaerolineae bacterium]
MEKIMRLIFCADPLNARQPDPMYKRETTAAEEQHIGFDLLNFEALVYDNNPVRAVQRIPQNDMMGTAVYRGWMLKPPQYRQLYEVLLERGIKLINTPDQYQHCHYLPDSYPVIEAHTPKTVWLKCDATVQIETLVELLRPFGDTPLIVKDFVKSQKHYWNEACYIPHASNAEAVERVVRRFLDLQGDDLNEGLVFREFIAFKPLTTHSKSGMPLTKEYRLFFVDGELLYTLPYWEQGDYDGIIPEPQYFLPVAKAVQSRFFTMDIAQAENGNWFIVELGDGQVAGLPEHANVIEFYRSLAHQLDADR